MNGILNKISKQVGKSITIVSRVPNNYDHTNPETKVLVNQVADHQIGIMIYQILVKLIKWESLAETQIILKSELFVRKPNCASIYRSHKEVIIIG